MKWPFSFLICVVTALTLPARAAGCDSTVLGADALDDFSTKASAAVQLPRETFFDGTAVSAPDPFQFIIESADPEDLLSLRMVISNRHGLSIHLGGQNLHEGSRTERETLAVSVLEFSPERQRFLVTATEGRRINQQIVINVDRAGGVAKAWMRERNRREIMSKFKLMATYRSAGAGSTGGW